MISVVEARNIVNSQEARWGVEYVKLADSIGRVLAEDAVSDRDFPPFDRVAMDGICVSYDDFQKGTRKFRIQDTQYAGEPALTMVGQESAIEIMTGAVLSQGADLVIRYEDIDIQDHLGEKVAHVNINEAERWNNIHRLGADNLKGDLLVKKGSVIHAGIIAILATIGQGQVSVYKLPKVAIVSTGNELVDVDQFPLPHQIRKSNTIAIQSVLNTHNISNSLYHLPDDQIVLKESIAEILKQHDILLLSGGVSKGKADYLPEVLAELGVKQLFHKVAQRPGKPFWFGVSQDNKQVFAFPGNPISTWMCFRVYCLPWILKNAAKPAIDKQAILYVDFNFRPQLGYFLQVKSQILENGHIVVTPQIGNGSGDLVNLAESDAFIYIPQEKEVCKKGERFEYFAF